MRFANPQRLPNAMPVAGPGTFLPPGPGRPVRNCGTAGAAPQVVRNIGRIGGKMAYTRRQKKSNIKVLLRTQAKPYPREIRGGAAWPGVFVHGPVPARRHSRKDGDYRRENSSPTAICPA